MDFSLYNGEVNYPGQAIDPEELKNYSKEIIQTISKYNGYFTRDTLLKLIREPIDLARSKRLKLYCGEFGCLPSVRRTIRLQWYKDVRYILEQNNIAWANWDYKGAFSIYNQQTGSVDNNLIKVLLENDVIKN
jgi:endoglucanase